MRKLVMFLTLALLFSCTSQEYTTTDDGVIVNVQNVESGGPAKIRLKVISDRIIRVTATPEKSFRDRNSIIISENNENKHFVVRNVGDAVSLQTSGLHVLVDKLNGKVSFADAGDNVITAETKPVVFENNTIGDTKGYSTINEFNTTEDEGLFGLGQHQSDQWNYKGQNEELFQYNTKISIPFVISSKNYGILWDSYSLARFGNPKPYDQINRVFKLFDKDGNQGSLTGTYFYPMRQNNLVREEDSIYFVDNETIGNLPRLGNFVLYEGSLEAPKSGEYNFILNYAGYIKLFLGDKEIVKERWRTAWNPNSYKFSIDMKEGQKYAIRIEWRPDGATSYCGLRAYSPVDNEQQEKLTMWNEMVPQSDYYFIAGDNIDGVIYGLRSLVGKANMMPKWAMGFWQSREHYRTQDEVLSTLSIFRNKGIGIDNIVQDWNYWEQDSWGSHDFDLKRYPDPKLMIDSVHNMGGHFMISVWPKFYATTDHYKEFAEKGWMYTRAVEDSIRDWVGPGYIGSFYDAYSSEARKLFWNQLKEHLYGFGIDAWWMDASEPNIRDCVSLDYWKALCGPTALGSSTEYLNAYSLVNAQAIYEGSRIENPNKRVFQLTRSGFAGLQRYSAASWSGDIGSRWEDMRSQIVAGMNYSLCGNPYWTMDIGGFCVENRYVMAQYLYDRTGIENSDLTEWRELQTRWYQFGAFVPIFRAHGQFPYREVWNIAPEDHPAYKSITYYNDLRYRLMPYIYSIAGRVYYGDYTIMRGLVMDYSDDDEAMNVSDQYMFGPSLMVCPVYEYEARSRSVYLPKGSLWYDFYDSSKVYEGGVTIQADAPYERIPLFVPAGAIIPEGPKIHYVDEVPADTISFHVYSGHNGHFNLYEDDGVTFGYEEGKSSIITLFYNDETKNIVILDRRGEYDGMIKERVFNICLHEDSGMINEKTVLYKGIRTTVNFKY